MNFEAAASETFQILRSYDYEVILFSDEHQQVFEPSEARRFFAKPVNLLVSLVDDGEDSAVRLYLSKSIRISEVIGLVSSLRTMATKYKMVFNVREYNKVLSPKDFATQASVTESKGNTMNLVEGMYGTSRSSYLKLENARMIVRHSTRINENILGARGRNVETIHIEDGQGQRFLMPTQQLAPARAMAHHVDNGGTWADTVGEQISRMAQNFADLGAASRHIGHYAPELHESATQIRDAVRECARNMRRTFESLGRKTRYADVAEGLRQLGETLNESSDEDYQGKVTELAGMLNTESVQLSERVLTTVARVVEGAAAAQIVEDAAETISVLGHAIHKDAWMAFKEGRIDLTQPVSEVPGSPVKTFKAVVAATQDATLTNFLSFILGEMIKPVDQRTVDTKNLRTITAKVLASAQKQIDPNEPVSVPAVREFLEWAGKVSSVNEADEAEAETVEEDGCMADRDLMGLDSALEEVDENCGECEGDDLTQEDILLPSKSDDLASEVTKSSVEGEHGDQAPDDNYINRLQSLAGVRGRGF